MKTIDPAIWDLIHGKSQKETKEIHNQVKEGDGVQGPKSRIGPRKRKRNWGILVVEADTREKAMDKVIGET